MKDELHAPIPHGPAADAGWATLATSVAPAEADDFVQVLADDMPAAARWCDALRGEGLAARVQAPCTFSACPPSPPPQAVVLHLTRRLAEQLDTLRRLRAACSRVPLLVVCHALRDLDHVLALEMGADDVQDGATAAPVIAARLRALSRRWRDDAAQATGPERLAFGRLSLGLRERRAALDGTTVALTEGEFELLWLLASQAGQAVTRVQLLQRLRGLPYQRIDRSIDCRIYRIRGKLGDGDGPAQHIRTVRNCGYLFSPAPW